MTAESFDVVVVGEILIEITTDASVAQGVPARIGFSGDALNVAAAAAAAGAAVGIAAIVGDDELGESIAAQVQRLGISDRLLRRRAGHQGMYLNHSDPSGERDFFYARTASVGSQLSPADLDVGALERAGAVVASGIAGAISDSSHHAISVAAHAARRFVYDPNYRPRLTRVTDATALLRELAAVAWLVTPSFPMETAQLLGARDPIGAARILRTQGAQNVAVTCGERGIQFIGDEGEAWIDAFPAPHVIDQTGAGDAFLGTTVARAVLGDDLLDALALGAAVAALSVGVRGGIVAAEELSEAHALVSARTGVPS